MALRDSMNSNPLVGVCVVAAIVAVAIVFTVMALSADPDEQFRVDKRWFYDLETKELFETDKTAVAPIAAPSGKEGVLAHVFGCGDCAGDTFTGYLETNSPEAREALLNSGTMDPEAVRKAVVEGNRIRSLEGNWVASRSKDGQALKKQVIDKCGALGKSLKPCYPR